MKKILFLSTHSFAANPRLVKEIRLALKNNYQVEIICFEFRNWSFQMNQEIKNEFLNAGATVHTIESGKKPVKPWLISFIAEKASRLAALFFSTGNAMRANAVSRRSHLLISFLKKVKNADIVIGHNPGALWPALVAGKRFKCQTGFDVEDYHPGEGHDKHLQKLTKKLMADTLPKMNYVSFASPLIMQQVKKDMHVPDANWFAVLNYFPASDFIEPDNGSGPVKMVWFSQNISAGRGLELILPFLKKDPGMVELHLFGHPDKHFYEKELQQIPSIIVHAPMPQIQLHHQLGKFDIGLALDIPLDKNRDLTITNKLMAYLQAGLFVVATNSTSQQSLLAELPGHGICFDFATNNSAEVFEKIIDGIHLMRAQKKMRYYNMANRNWESEGMKLINIWN